MTDRPTPEQIADTGTETDAWYGRRLLNELAREGYVIVHPDDVPDYLSELAENDQRDYDYGRGWNACRDDIFRGQR